MKVLLVGVGGVGEAIAIHRKRAAGRNLICIGRLHHQRVEPAHFLVQQADGIALCVVGAEGIGADQLGQPVGLVRLGLALRAHLVEHHGHSAADELPGGLRSSEAATDDMDGGDHGART